MRSHAIAEEGSRKGDFLAGKYLLEDCLGIGGMGEVYRATNVSLDRKVAIKLLNADFAKNEDDVLRFLREARAAAAVRHPNVVDVIDVAREDDGTPFIVQELLSGDDLEVHLHNSGGRLSPEEILDIMIPVADAIAAAHAKNVVHRDLKPANIFLSREGVRIVPKVLDFGACLYKTMGGVSSKEARMLIGTPHYMAPEQVIADKELDARADVWALGVILYELLVGETPFEAENVNDVLRLVRTRKIPPFAAVAPGTPPVLAAVITRCLNRVRADRYIDAAELHDALEQARNVIRGPMSEPAPQSRRRVDSRAEIDDTASEVRTKAPAQSALPSLVLGPRPNAKKGPTKRRGSALLTLSMPDEGVPSSHPPRGRELDLTPPSGSPASVERPVAREWPLPPASSPSPLGFDSEPNLASLDLELPRDLLDNAKMPSSIPPVLAPPRRATPVPRSSPMAMPSQPPARTSSSANFAAIDASAIDSSNIGLAAVPSSRASQSSMNAVMPRPASQPAMNAVMPRHISSSMEAVRPSQTGLTPPLTSSVSRRTPMNPLPAPSMTDTFTTLGISVSVGIAAFVGLSFVKAITAPLGRALRGETTIGCGLITIATLVSTVILAVRWSSSRSKSTLVATIGTGIFAILMIIATFGASEAAELGIPSAVAPLLPFLAPIAPVALVVNLVSKAKDDWSDDRANAFKSTVFAALFVVVALATSPIGVVRTPAPRAPSSSGR